MHEGHCLQLACFCLDTFCSAKASLPHLASPFPAPQLARSLGVEQVAVVVTKLDTCDFDQQRFEAIK